MQDADFDPPAPKSRPGKASHKAPDPTKGKAVVKENGTTAVVATEADKTELAELVTDKPYEILADEKKREALYTRLRKMVAEQKPDLSTQAGRDRVKSFAYKIVRTRTALDAAGKEANASLRDQINAVDALRRDMEATMKKIEAEARQPLTDWEADQEKKAEERRNILQDIARAVSWSARENPPVTADECRELLEMVEAIAIDADLWGDEVETVTARQSEAVSVLRSKIETIELREKLAAAQAEAEKLRGQVEREPAAPAVEPVIEQRELPPTIDSEGAPAAEEPAPELTPIQKARRLCLPPLGELGISGDLAKALILAIEAGKIPGITATYQEQDQ